VDELNHIRILNSGMHSPGRGPSRRALLRSVGVAVAGLGVIGLGDSARAHERATRTDDSAAAATDTRTPDPDSYEPLATLSLSGVKELVTSADGTVGYAAVTDGYATIDLSDPASPTLLTERRGLLADHEGGPLQKVHDVAVDGDRLLVVGPANPVSGGLNAALLVDVSDPTDPARLAVLPTDFPIHNGVLQDGHAYLTANGVSGNPLVIVDVRDAVATGDIREVGRWSLFDHDERWREVSPTLRPLHDVWVADDVAYLAYWDAGTWLVDVSDPTAPASLGHVGDSEIERLMVLDGREARRQSTTSPGNSHYVATDAAGSLLAVGKETWALDDGATGGPSGIDLYDCTDPTAPSHLASIDPPPSPDPTRGGYWTTAHNFGFAGDVLYSSWYQGGVKRHDVSDPADPREMTWWREPAETSFWTARAAVPGEYFVAADMSVSGVSGVDADAAVYVFRDREGAQSPPPEPALTVDSEPMSTATSERDWTATATPEPTTGDDSTVRAPGFGVGGALAGLAVGAWLRLRRRG
jgi:hypothetical protein